MRRGWRRVAECGDNRAFAPEEVSNAIIPALEQDCRAELPPEFVDALCGLYRDQESSLFQDQMTPELESLRGFAGHAIGQVVLDHAIRLSQRGETGLLVAVKAMTAALTETAGCGARQVEEHFLRKSTAPRALKVRARMEAGIASAGADIEALARRTLKIDSGPPPRMPKNQGLDDGVRF